jgi:hypothetical protein
VGRADWAVHMFAAFRSFRFWASLGNLCARAAWTRLRADDFHCHRLLLLFFGMVWADWAMADTFATFGSFRFRASFGDFHAGAARKGRRADEFHRHRLSLLFGVVWWADRAVADKFAVFRSLRFRASLGGLCTRAARARCWAIGWDSDGHHWLRLLFFGVVGRADWAVHMFAAFWSFRFWASLGNLCAGAARARLWADDFHRHWFVLLFFGVVRLADRAEANKCAVCWSFRFRASFWDFLTGATGKGGWASGIRLHRGFSEFHLDVVDADMWADERAFEELAMVGSFNWRTTLWRAFARTTWARRRANLLLEG